VARNRRFDTRPAVAPPLLALARRGLARRLTLLTSLALLAGCAPNYTAFQIDQRLSKTLGAAQFHLGLREYAEAAQLARAIENIDPEYPGLIEVNEGLKNRSEDLFAASLLGSNRARRKPIERSMGGRIARYLPDRLSDLFDIFTLDAHSGLGGFADVHATRAVQLVGGARVVGGLGSYSQRNAVGFQLQADAGAAAMGIGRHRFVGFIAGPGGVYTGTGDLSGVQQPMDRFYQDFRDYWGIGASATFGFVGASAELHPVQVVDFVLGWFGWDLTNDDSAYSAPLRLLTSERDLLQELARIRSSDSLTELYLRNRGKLQSPSL